VPSLWILLNRNLAASCTLAAVLFVPCCGPIPPIQAQEKTATAQSPQADLKIESNLVEVRVVVHDSHGQPVKGLKKEDFNLFDRGRKQSVAQFEEEADDGTSILPPTVANGQTPDPILAASAERFIAFYFDNLNSTEADLIQARDAADRFIASGVQPNERIAIFTVDDLLLDFTSDSKQIRDALSRLHASPRAPGKERLCPGLSDYQAVEILRTNDLDSNAWRAALAESRACGTRSIAGPTDSDASKPDSESVTSIRMLARSIVDRSRMLARASLQQLDQVTMLIARAPGDRSVILVSPGFLSESEQYRLDSIIDRAIRSKVVISSLDPKGLAILTREADASGSSTILPDPQATQARHSLDAAKEFARSDVLAEIAQGTGGEFFHDDNDLQSGFSGLAARPAEYVLAFVPSDMRLDGKFHELKVSLAQKHKGYSIKARRGYFASANPPDSVARAAQPQAQTDAARAPTPTAHTDANPPEVRAAETVLSAPARADVAPLHLHNGMNRVTVQQLEQFLVAAHGKTDADLTRKLSEFQLTERLTTQRLAEFAKELPGPQAKAALLAQADASAFLNPPAAELPAAKPPDVDTQSQWLKSAVGYVAKTLSTLPNFFATRDLTLFADTPPIRNGGIFLPQQPLHRVDQSEATVLYREGKEVVDSGQTKTRNLTSEAPGLITTGEFGPVLGMVLADAARSSLTWSHWEAGAAGPVAVYRYAVPREKSHYQVRFCCVPNGSAMTVYRQLSAYHGEITVNPADGTILRLTLQADLKPSYPMAVADILVEYGPVEIGGKTYICPLKSVALAKANVQPPLSDVDRRGLRGQLSDESNGFDSPVQTLLNDVAFEQYHVFRAESRVLPADTPAPK
jgi:VWFA-related protein